MLPVGCCVAEEMDTNAMHGTAEVPRSSGRHLPPFETKGIKLSLSHTHTHKVAVVEPVKPHGNMKVNLIIHGERWRNFMIWAMIKDRVVGFIYG